MNVETEHEHATLLRKHLPIDFDALWKIGNRPRLELNILARHCGARDTCLALRHHHSLQTACTRVQTTSLAKEAKRSLERELGLGAL